MNRSNGSASIGTACAACTDPAAGRAVPGFPDPLLQALRTPRARTDYADPPLIVTTATLASTRFCTDRGRLQLPAWEVRAIDVPDPIWVLDPSVSQQAWQPPAPYVPDWPGSIAVVEADGRTITMTFTSSPYFVPGCRDP